MNVVYLPSYIVLYLLLFTLPLAHALLPQLPSLYLDHVKMTGSNGSAMTTVAGGFNYSLSWRQTLPGVHASCMALYNFQTSYNSILSYKTSFPAISTSTATANLQLVGSGVDLISLSFSIIIITQPSLELELLTLENTTMNYLDSNGVTLTATSTTFNFTTSMPYVNWFYEWVTADTSFTVSSNYNYWTYARMNVSSSSNQIMINFWTGTQIYMTGVKINVLLVGHATGGGNSTAMYANYTQSGRYFSQNMTYNFGIDSNSFGSSVSGHCFHGMYVIDMYVYSNSTPTSYSSFLFTYNNSEVSGLTWSDIWGCRIMTVCYGQCPANHFFNSTQCVACSSAYPYCLKCTASECSVCQSGGFVLSTNKKSCTCPSRTIFNTATNICDLCPYDCYTCDLAGKCLSCSRNVDYRELNITSSRCQPLPGYFQSNTSVSGKCSTSCTTCTSALNCFVCDSRFYLNNASTCTACPYDCFTCNSTSNACLSCSDSDYRQLNQSSNRCIPISGYYESFTSVSAKCQSTCKQCTSKTSCSSCAQGYKLDDGGCKEGDSSSIILWVFGGIFIAGTGLYVLVGIGVVIYARCCKRQERTVNTIPVGVSNQILEGHHPQDQISENIMVEIQGRKAKAKRPKNLPPIGKAKWKDRKQSQEVNAYCSICLFPGTQFRSVCGHEFHIKCISQWSNRNPICPNCRNRLFNQNHHIFCLDCGQSQRKVSFDVVKIINGTGKQRKDVICNKCIDRPKKEEIKMEEIKVDEEELYSFD